MEIMMLLTMPDETKHRADGACPRPYHSPASTEFPEPAPAMPPVSVPPSSKSRTSATPGGKWDDVLYAYIFIVDTMRSLVLLSGKEGRERTSSSSYFDAGVDGTLLTGLVHAPGGLVPGGSTALDASLAVLRDQMNLAGIGSDPAESTCASDAASELPGPDGQPAEESKTFVLKDNKAAGLVST